MSKSTIMVSISNNYSYRGSNAFNYFFKYRYSYKKIADNIESGNSGSNDNKPNDKPSVSKPEKPEFNIPMPTLESVQKNYSVEKYGVDVHKAIEFNCPKPVVDNSNYYLININDKFISSHVDIQSKTLYIPLDPTLSKNDAKITVNFKDDILNNESLKIISEIKNFVIYIKKIPEELLPTNFKKNMDINLKSIQNFSEFTSLENFIIYEQEQSCFKAPTNYVTICEFPPSLKNLYLDATFFNISEDGSFVDDDYFKPINLETFTYDLATDSLCSAYLEIVSFFIQGISLHNYTESPNIELYQTVSPIIDSYDDINGFINNNSFMELNKDYTGYKIPYYSYNYLNPFYNKFAINQPDFPPTFSIPEDHESDVYKVFAWDYYWFKIGKLHLSVVDDINDELSRISNIEMPYW